MLELLLPSMSAAANERQAARSGGRMRRFRRRSESNDKRNSNMCGVTGTGVGILVWKLLESIGNLSPLVLSCAHLAVERLETVVAVMEHCIDCWLLRSSDVSPLVSAMRGVVDEQEEALGLSGVSEAVVSLQERKQAVDALIEQCCSSSAWLALYTLTLYVTMSGFKTKSDALLTVTKALDSAAEDDLSRLKLYKAIPLICTWMDLLLSPLRGVSTALKVEQLCKVREKLLHFAEPRSGLALSISGMSSMLAGKIIPRDDLQLLALSLSTFLHLNCSKTQGRLRLKSSDPLDMGRKTQLLVSSLSQVARHKESAGAVKNFVTDMRHTLEHTHALIDLLCEQLFPSHKWLAREAGEILRYPPEVEEEGCQRVSL